MAKSAARPPKPSHTSPASSARSLGGKWAWKSLLVSLVAVPVGWYLQGSGLDPVLDHFRPVHQDSYWDRHREEVKDAFVVSWDAYSKYAWGMYYFLF